MKEEHYDIAIIGGGLAGLSAANLLAAAGLRVVLFEKEQYPFHRVCGEYISMESWDFLQSLGLPLHNMDLPRIHTLQLTAPRGAVFEKQLPLGGFGISRYLLDARLAALARDKSAMIYEGSKVEEVVHADLYTIRAKCNDGITRNITARLCLAGFGKRSNLDLRWKRPFLLQQDRRLQNYVGVKYHLESDWKEGLIGLHNFEDGYCGISKIEEDKHCLCYLTTAANLKRSGQSIPELEATVLSQNLHLARIFKTSRVIEGFPVTISQINFHKKETAWDGIIMMGDAAGMITPLCGNGMSIALHTGKIAAGLAIQFMEGKINQASLEKMYKQAWQKEFGRRLAMGRMLQSFFGRTELSNAFVGLFRTLPFLARTVIRQTHGKPF